MVLGAAQEGLQYQLRRDGVYVTAVLLFAAAVGAEDIVRLDAGAALVAEPDLGRAVFGEQGGEGSAFLRARALAVVHVAREAEHDEAAAALAREGGGALREARGVPLGDDLRLSAEYAALVRYCDSRPGVSVIQGHYSHFCPSFNPR